MVVVFVWSTQNSWYCCDQLLLSPNSVFSLCHVKGESWRQHLWWNHSCILKVFFLSLTFDGNCTLWNLNVRSSLVAFWNLDIQLEIMSANEVNCNSTEMGRPSESAAQCEMDGPERVTKPRDKRLDRLTKKRWQFSSRSQSSQWSEGSFEATESGKVSLLSSTQKSWINQTPRPCMVRRSFSCLFTCCRLGVIRSGSLEERGMGCIVRCAPRWWQEFQRTTASLNKILPIVFARLARPTHLQKSVRFWWWKCVHT